MIVRRTLLKGLLALGFSGASLGAYAFGIEPRFLLSVTRYRLTPARWPLGLRLRLAVVADVHVGAPYMPLKRVSEIVARTNILGADAILVLGDYQASYRWVTHRIPAHEWAPVLAGLKAPLGVHAVLGNHDWWDDPEAQQRGRGPTLAGRALERAGVPVYENDAVRLTKAGHSFWLAGLGDQLAFRTGRVDKWERFRGVDDLQSTLAKIDDSSPVILMAHEPDIFPDVPSRVAVTVCGHTHGGQVRIAGYSPIVPSKFGNRYAYGHVVENNRDLIVSGGLGCSKLPIRFGMPPEIVVIDLEASEGDADRTGINPV
ncbi:MAG: metallophosphoesterase [Hyphomicrobiaceae bacterium]